MTEHFEFYRGKRIFITGHTGFKGAWLTFCLSQLGAIVGGYSLAPTPPINLFTVLDLETSCDHYEGDIRDKEEVTQAMSSFRPDIVFHLAAQALVRPSYHDPIFTFDTNVMGTVNVYEAVRQLDCIKAVVTITSDKCYDNTEAVHAFKESDCLGGYDPYSASKACAEIVSGCYRKSFFTAKGIGLATVRAGNVIGGGDWAEDRLVPDCVRALSQGKTITLRYPQAIRPWQHVLDPLFGYLDLAKRLYETPAQFSEAFNFGPSQDDILTVEDMVKMILRYWPGNYAITQDDILHEMVQLRLDTTKVQDLLMWRPVYSVTEAIGKTIEWYKAYYAHSTNMTDFSKQQVLGYLQQL